MEKDIQTPTLFDIAEQTIAKYNSVGMSVMLKYRGVLVYGFRPQTDQVEEEVYGEYARTPKLWDKDRKPDFITKVLPGEDDFISFDNLNTSNITGGFFLSDYPFKPGDVIQFRRKDSMRKYWSISREVQLGITTSIIRKFEFASFDA